MTKNGTKDVKDLRWGYLAPYGKISVKPFFKNIKLTKKASNRLKIFFLILWLKFPLNIDFTGIFLKTYCSIYRFSNKNQEVVKKKCFNNVLYNKLQSFKKLSEIFQIKFQSKDGKKRFLGDLMNLLLFNFIFLRKGSKEEGPMRAHFANSVFKTVILSETFYWRHSEKSNHRRTDNCKSDFFLRNALKKISEPIVNFFTGHLWYLPLTITSQGNQKLSAGYF